MGKWAFDQCMDSSLTLYCRVRKPKGGISLIQTQSEVWAFDGRASALNLSRVGVLELVTSCAQTPLHHQ